MTQVSSMQDYRSEKAIIDALLKISEIVQKTETNRQYQQTYKRSKKTVGDGDYNESMDEQQQQVPIPPPMRTLESYISGFNQNSAQKSSKYQQASENKQYRVHEHVQKRPRSDSSFQFPQGREDKQPWLNQTAVRSDRQQVSSVENFSIDGELQILLEKYLKNHLVSSNKSLHDNIGKQRQARLASFTKFPREKLLNEFHPSHSIVNLNHYNKQRQLALLATKQGNYTLSYSIYTDLLHDFSNHYQLKSDILAARAMALLLDDKCFESIDDCTRSIAYNQWNKFAYVVRGACWMIKQEYHKAVEDYSKLFHFFEQTQSVLDLLNLAYEKSRSYSFTSSTISSIQPAVYLCYPYQTSSKTNETIQSIIE